MKKPQIILVIGAAILLFSLYYWGNPVPPAKTAEQNMTGRPMQRKLDFEQIKMNAFTKLDSAKVTAIRALDGKTDVASLTALSDLWAEAKQGTMSAKYKADLAKLENTEKSLTFASQYFIDLYTIEQDTALKVWQAAQAAELLEKAVAMNSSNIAAKVKLAQSYTDGTGETMKGVLMLREVAQTDPSNLAAGITLGRLAVQSGQFDKAITRLEKLLIAHPKNTEAMYFLAESYKGQGNTAKAKELFNECKKIVNNPNFTKEIDDYIKTF
ncbi:MAG: hypothetical protein RLZZ118_1204 [Bacteroidota bacterium]|jgi:predicted Zn-dependent protease